MRPAPTRDELRFPVGHHMSPSRAAKSQLCPQRFFLEDVQGAPREEFVPYLISGNHAHGAAEEACRRRLAAGIPLARPVTVDELLEAWRVVENAQPVSAEAIEQAREHLEVAAPFLDFSAVAIDEHGALVERAGLVQCGDGIVAGLIADRVDLFEEDRVVLVVDYKFAHKRESDPVNNIQVGLLAAWGRQRWEGWRVLVELVYPILGYKLPAVEGTPKLEENAKTVVRALVKRTREEKRAEAWPARFGAHCAGCSQTSGCAVYQNNMRAPVGAKPPLVLEELVPAAHEAQVLASLWKKRHDELTDAIKPLAPIGKSVIAGHPVSLKKVDGYPVKARVQSPFMRLEIKAKKAEAEQLPDAIEEREVPLLPASVKDRPRGKREKAAALPTLANSSPADSPPPSPEEDSVRQAVEALPKSANTNGGFGW